MIHKFDYQEPACPLCSGKDFYYPQKNAPLGRIPVARILDRVDSLFWKNDYAEAGRLLVYWKEEAVALRDPQGELAMESELIGYYRKQNDPEKGLASAARALELVEALEQGDMASGATVFINCATAYQAFGRSAEALILYRRAEKIYRQVLPAGDGRFGGLYNNMALALVSLEQYPEAAEAYGCALAVMEKVPRGEAECAITYINLAYLYSDMGTPEKIGGCMDRAYALLQSENLPRDGYYAFVLEKCAPAFQDFGRPEICLQLKRESEEIYARA